MSEYVGRIVEAWGPEAQAARKIKHPEWRWGGKKGGLPPVGTHLQLKNGQIHKVTSHSDGRVFAQRHIDGKPDGQAAAIGADAVSRAVAAPGDHHKIATGLRPGEGAPYGQWTQHSSGDMEIEMPEGGPTAQITQDEHGGPGKVSAYVFKDAEARDSQGRHDFSDHKEAKRWADHHIKKHLGKAS